MIKVGVNVDLKYKDEIFLIVVCMMGCVIVVEELLKVGVDVNISDEYYILLIIVLNKDYFELVEFLLK